MSRSIIKSESRGAADYGWLKTRYSFSFADYYDSERVNFGVLRVLNDDIIEGGRGFDTHPHSNMEIITIPLAGDLAHKDSMGHESLIRQGDIQVMSAGKGITHSEYNANTDSELKLLQIWIFPKERELSPRYDQKVISDLAIEDSLFTVLSPDKDEKGVWIHQDAWFSMGNFSKDSKINYSIRKPGNGIYLFVIKGKVVSSGETLESRDALSIDGEDTIDLTISGGTEILLMDIPMNF